MLVLTCARQPTRRLVSLCKTFTLLHIYYTINVHDCQFC
nr:MAG TPA: hypothetical protein [Caudoviricetes sp.]